MKTYTDCSLVQWRKLLKQCSGKRIALDVETTGLKWWADRLTTISFHCPDAGLEGSIDGDVIKMEAAADLVRDLLAPSTTLIFHNAKFDMSFLAFDPEYIPWQLIDTTVLIHLYDSRLSKKLAEAERVMLGENTKREHVAAAPGGKLRKRIWDWPPDIRQAYNINDCRVTYQLAQALVPEVRELGLIDLLKKDMAYVKVLYGIEHYGMHLDLEFVANARTMLQQHTLDLAQQLYDAVGYEFNWRSNAQLSYAIYENLNIAKPVNPFLDKHGVDRSRFAETGKYNKTMTSTFLLMEKAKHPLGELIMALRESYKLARTMLQWLELVDSQSVIHTNFNPTGTRTGRLSSSKPNLQNVASDTRSHFTQGVFSGGMTRTNEYNLRLAFKARPGYKFLSIDYKQMEIRAFAVLAQDPAMLKIVLGGLDVHRKIGAQVWGIADDLHREWAKTVSFGMLYGMSAGSLMFKLNMTREGATKVTEDYWRAFPRTKPWMHEIMKECETYGYVRYWSGRIWREDEPNMYFKGVNAAIQGGCADLLSVAAMRVDRWLKARPKGYGHIVSLIHDELLMEIREDVLLEAATELGIIMQVPDLMGIPFLTDAKVGDSYGNLEKLKKPEPVPTGATV